MVWPGGDVKPKLLSAACEWGFLKAGDVSCVNCMMAWYSIPSFLMSDAIPSSQH